MKPKALILHANGTNRDHEASYALAEAGADPEIVPLNLLRRRIRSWRAYQILLIPGGFSYADALGAGKLLAIDLITYFADEVRQFIACGKPVIGICNGFQALVKSGLLPFPQQVQETNATPRATLSFNANGQFECRWVTMKPISNTCLWTRDLQGLVDCPSAHGEGNFILAEDLSIRELRQQDMIALTYTHPDGSPASGLYPYNPNGSVADIAGICNPAGNVLGLMPHPEDHIYPYQHPQHVREFRGRLGLTLFQQGVAYAKES
jgi:phosphoribosylformylglycinamidine synthase I